MIYASILERTIGMTRVAHSFICEHTHKRTNMKKFLFFFQKQINKGIIEIREREK